MRSEIESTLGSLSAWACSWSQAALRAAAQRAHPAHNPRQRPLCRPCSAPQTPNPFQPPPCTHSRAPERPGRVRCMSPLTAIMRASISAAPTPAVFCLGVFPVESEDGSLAIDLSTAGWPGGQNALGRDPRCARTKNRRENFANGYARGPGESRRSNGTAADCFGQRTGQRHGHRGS